jgi:hypothetical protein
MSSDTFSGNASPINFSSFSSDSFLKKSSSGSSFTGSGLILSALICFSVFTGDAVKAERDRFLEPLGADVAFFLDWVFTGSGETKKDKKRGGGVSF